MQRCHLRCITCNPRNATVSISQKYGIHGVFGGHFTHFAPHPPSQFCIRPCTHTWHIHLSIFCIHTMKPLSVVRFARQCFSHDSGNSWTGRQVYGKHSRNGFTPRSTEKNLLAKRIANTLTTSRIGGTRLGLGDAWWPKHLGRYRYITIFRSKYLGRPQPSTTIPRPAATLIRHRISAEIGHQNEPLWFPSTLDTPLTERLTSDGEREQNDWPQVGNHPPVDGHLYAHWDPFEEAGHGRGEARMLARSRLYVYKAS